MEERKIRVAITHGDTNGIGYEVILKAFEDPTMLELCTPIVYGSPKVASYHRKALGLETQFLIVDKAEDARDGRLNLLTTFDEEVKVEFGTPTDESDTAARKAVARAKEDLQKGLYDVLVQAPMRSNANPGKEDKSLTMMVSDLVRIGLVTTHLLPASAVISASPIPASPCSPSTPSWAQKKRQSSSLPSSNSRNKAFRPLAPMWLMTTSARRCIMILMVCSLCTTIRVLCLSRRLPSMVA